MADTMTLTRVANGWVLQPGGGAANDFTHIAATPEDLAAHVAAWAKAQAANDFTHIAATPEDLAAHVAAWAKAQLPVIR